MKVTISKFKYIDAAVSDRKDGERVFVSMVKVYRGDRPMANVIVLNEEDEIKPSSKEDLINLLAKKMEVVLNNFEETKT